MRTTTFQAIGTHWSISIQTPLNDAAWNDLLGVIEQRIEVFDRNYSRFRSDSLASRMQQPGVYDLPDDAYKLFRFYRQLYDATDGLVTPLIGQTLSDAGYDADYSLKPGKLTAPPTWNKALRLTKKTLQIHQPVLLDLGAAGKGYLIDIVGTLLEQAGAVDYVIDGSGDIRQRTSTTEAIEIGLENPLDTSEVIGTARLHNRSLCASAGSRRKWDKYHHIINPSNLESPRDIIATWVMADETMIADGLSTALFFAKPEQLQQTFAFSYAILHHDMVLQASHDFPAITYAAETA